MPAVPLSLIPGTPSRIAAGSVMAAAMTMPAAVAVAILRYRLYDIDRLISRTLAYAIVTGLLIGVYAGLVLLSTQVFHLHAPSRGRRRYAGRGGPVQPGPAAGAADGGRAVQPRPL